MGVTPDSSPDKHRRRIMAAKKIVIPDTSHKTHKGRRPKAAEVEDLATEAPPLPEPAAASAEKTSADRTAESSRIATLTPAEEAPAKEERPTAPPSAKLSALDAAAKVLGETGRPLTCAELIAAMVARGYWSSPKGRTPASTLYSAVLRELKTKGAKARFLKTERGKFTLRRTV
jgi:hypothetical protein